MITNSALAIDGLAAWPGIGLLALLKLQRTRVGRAVVRRSAAKDLSPLRGETGDSAARRESVSDAA